MIVMTAKDRSVVKLQKIEDRMGRITGAEGIPPEELTELKGAVPELVKRYREADERNRKMTDALRRAHNDLAQAESDRAEFTKAQAFLQQLEEVPLRYGVLRSYGDTEARVLVGSEELQVAISPAVDRSGLAPGKEIMLSGGALVRAAGYPAVGTSARVRDVLPDDRLIVTLPMGSGESVVYWRNGKKPKPGNTVLLDKHGAYAVEILPRDEKKDLYIEEVPRVTWDDVGGLDGAIRDLITMVKYPYLYPDKARKYKLGGGGVLLHGPPGCGKTYLVKALLNDMADAREKLKAEGKKVPPLPAIVFFDEADSLFSTRGTGMLVDGGGGSTMSDTIVPQLLAEMQGLEELNRTDAYDSYTEADSAQLSYWHIAGPELLSKWVGESEETLRAIYASARERSPIVITILATNRPDKLDPALVREGRIDKKIQVARPDEAGTRKIFEIYLDEQFPVAAQELKQYGSMAAWRDHAIDELVSYLFDDEPVAYVEYRNGNRRELYRRDLLSGAKIASIVKRAGEAAFLREVEGGEEGATIGDAVVGTDKSYIEEVDILTSGSPYKWSQILGKESDLIARITAATRYATLQQVHVYQPRRTAV